MAMKILIGITLIFLAGCNTTPTNKEIHPMLRTTKIDEHTTELASGVRHTEYVFGDWNSVKIQDPLKTDVAVLICTDFTSDMHATKGQFCFRMFSANLAFVEPQSKYGKGSWPYCEFDTIDYKIDGHKPGVVPQPRGRGGYCASGIKTDSSFFDEMSSGGVMAMKLHYTRGKVSLNGFSEALEYAKKQYTPRY